MSKQLKTNRTAPSKPELKTAQPKSRPNRTAPRKTELKIAQQKSRTEPNRTAPSKAKLKTSQLSQKLIDANGIGLRRTEPNNKGGKLVM